MNFGSITLPSVFNIAVWLLGEYSVEADLCTSTFEELSNAVGKPPYNDFFATKTVTTPKAPEDSGPTAVTRSVVLSDGTYATQVEYIKKPPINDRTLNIPMLRKIILAGDVFLGGALCGAMTKLTLRSIKAGQSNTKSMQLQTLHVICGVAKVAEVVSHGNSSTFADSLERISLCAKVLLDPSTAHLLDTTFLEKCRTSYASLLEFREEMEISSSDEGGSEIKRNRIKKSLATEEKTKDFFVGEADDLISFRQLRLLGVQAGDVDLFDGDDIGRVTGTKGDEDDLTNRLSHQLSGFSDPVYAEAYVTVHDYDIVLEILVINRTSSTLTNLTVELATMGDLKLIERPQSYTVGPQQQKIVKANIKVSSTETGHIFGTIVYSNSSTSESTYINLNDIQLDIMDYIRPATCTDESFRLMWAEFEWENKVAINTNFTDLMKFLRHVVTKTKTCCLTPYSSLEGDSSFLAANLHAKSVFGEDALINLSIEKKDDADGRLNGYVRIRSKTQGIALSLGDRITAIQRDDAEILTN